MNKYLSIFAFLLLSGSLFAQDMNMGDPGFPIGNEVPCATYSDGSTPNFFDDQGAGGNYSPNFNDTITYCPDLTQGTKMTLTWGINAGFSFDVDGSDSIYVYDGPDANSPFLGAHNTVTDPNGFAYTASWNNPSGCLTVVFISDGATEGAGWAANASCGNVNQPFEPHIEAFVNGIGANALNPIDTGYVDICFGDSILFVAKPIFPNSAENNSGYGYSQTVDNVDFDWYISDGGTYANNDSIWFTPPARNGYLVDLKITDMFPQSERMLCKVRVSQLPSFAGTGPEQDTVCLGQNTNLIGGVTPTDTVGIDIPAGSFELGGSFAGLTYLPDGSGAQYQAPIDIGGFPAGSTITNSQDLNQVCITMEHSYLGDLEIALECPNGTQVTLVNSYSPGFIPGGFGGGGTYLGDADDNSGNGVPGIGWEYCFSSVFNTWGDMPTEFAGGNTIPGTISGGQSMNPNGVYLPEQDFSAFAGCPINGQWTIIVQDNLTIDDGYIFEWGLFFDPSFFPGLNGYQNTVVSEDWVNDPTIISGQNDTLLVVQPDTPGNYGYTYEIVDDFGCEYDTTVFLNVLPLPAVQADTIGCNLAVWLQGTTSYSGGVWSVSDTSVHFLPDEFADNPQVYTTVPGTYTVTYTDNSCGMDTSLNIEFPDYVWVAGIDTTICYGVEHTISTVGHSSITNYDWSTGGSESSITVTEPGAYVIEVSNACHFGVDTIYIDYKLCDIVAPNIISLSSLSGNEIWYVESEGLSEFHCTITNRWGNVIYEYSDPNGGWDGTFKGKKVAEGTYFYIIDAVIEGGDELQKHGFIQVVH